MPVLYKGKKKRPLLSKGSQILKNGNYFVNISVLAQVLIKEALYYNS
ncbi:hypothetical protein CEV31_0908 [Brucella thiophenivorans]|uniref:Uncharacterized protein n=1 Tax=Brucella thiophenivorans TaxID=571255 RepID=A0A256G0S3_9HYPH|nr:hypothetical protein CEV31_0908 [Brucella thiophenivorans]